MDNNWMSGSQSFWWISDIVVKIAIEIGDIRYFSYVNIDIQSALNNEYGLKLLCIKYDLPIAKTLSEYLRYYECRYFTPHCMLHYNIEYCAAWATIESKVNVLFTDNQFPISMFSDEMIVHAIHSRGKDILDSVKIEDIKSKLVMREIFRLGDLSSINRLKTGKYQYHHGTLSTLFSDDLLPDALISGKKDVVNLFKLHIAYSNDIVAAAYCSKNRKYSMKYLEVRNFRYMTVGNTFNQQKVINKIIEYGNVEALQLFCCEHKIDISDQKYNTDCIIFCCKSGNLGMLQYLVEKIPSLLEIPRLDQLIIQILICDNSLNLLWWLNSKINDDVELDIEDIAIEYFRRIKSNHHPDILLWMRFYCDDSEITNWQEIAKRQSPMSKLLANFGMR